MEYSRIIDILSKQGGTIVSFYGANTLRARYQPPVAGAYGMQRSSNPPRDITTGDGDRISGNLFVDASHVPQEALQETYASRSAALSRMRYMGNQCPQCNYYQVVSETVRAEGSGADVAQYHFEPVN